ncbi:MAG: NAD(P)-dependent dehydrogenase (short-subunit alcohol dehydrogenase family) [Planctomycetota bacterium]|jgi:NAD(P)-dependent dehydrogenase (short-subunit alcohol dehydrogenase family)
MKLLALALVTLPLAALPFRSSLQAPAVAATATSPAATTTDDGLLAVLVTGASSGIGRRTAEHLAANGFFVYAGARKVKDLAALDKLENVQGIRLDVNVQADIDAAVETVRKAGRGLHGLINNAGVFVMAPLTEVTEDDLRFQMNVNVYGPYRVTKAFSDLLIESGGRVSTTGSISGIVTWGLGGPYTMSKHAVEAYTDVLAAELEPLGVLVSIVEPGNFRSRIFQSTVERMTAQGYTAKGSRFEPQLDGFLSRDQSRSNQADPLPVAEAFLDAMTSKAPKRRYMVTPNQREADMTLNAALKRVAELNQSHQFSVDRKELHKRLDEALNALDQ